MLWLSFLLKFCEASIISREEMRNLQLADGIDFSEMAQLGGGRAGRHTELTDVRTPRPRRAVRLTAAGRRGEAGQLSRREMRPDPSWDTCRGKSSSALTMTLGDSQCASA